MYRVEFTAAAGREMERIARRDKMLYARFAAAIDALAQDPGAGKRLKGPLSGDMSLRVGDYRIIYTVFKEKLTVVVIDLGHRREIYR